MSKISGHCLCGSVSYSSPAEPVTTLVCHCEHCQRQAGTAFSVVLAVPEESLTIEGEDNLRTFEDMGETGQQVDRRFCGKCGSPIISVVHSVQGLVFIKTGTLNDRSWLEPEAHIWCDSAQSWYEIPKLAARMPRNPPA